MTKLPESPNLHHLFSIFYLAGPTDTNHVLSYLNTEAKPVERFVADARDSKALEKKLNKTPWKVSLR